MWGRGTVKVTRKFFAAVAARDLAACAKLMHPQMRYLDSRGNAVEGLEDCLVLLERLFAFAEESKTVLHSVTAVGGVGLVRARVVSADTRLDGEALWKVRVERGLVRELETHRLDGRPTVRILAPDVLDMPDDVPPET